MITASLAETVPASALPGTPVPFDPNLAQAFLIQGDSGTAPGTFVLQRAQVQPDGTAVYVDEGTVGIQANGIGFNAADGFVYATTYGNATPANTLIRIGQGGIWEIGKTPADADCTLPAAGTDDYLAGTVVGGSYYAFLPAVGATTSFTMQKVDLATCTRTTYTVTGLANPPSTVPLPFDLTVADGFLWGVNGNGFLVRIPLSAGAVQYTNLAGILPTGNPYGAAWTMGSGNPVFQNNATGDFFQLDTTPILSGNQPVLVSRVNAPTNTQNDGTFVPGLPVDLALDKSGPDLYQAPQQLTYTFAVHNDGPGASSGAVVRDQLPSGLTYVNSSTACSDYDSQPTLPACVAGDTNLGFSVPAIAAGADYTFTVTVALAAGATGTKTNTATVIPNDADTDQANNIGSTTMVPGPATIALDKQVASITDTNGNNLDDTGDVVHYTFLVTNTSPVTIVNVVVTDPLVGTVTCPSTSLAPGDSTACTGSYPITQADVDAGSRSNTATASATTAGGIPTNQPTDSTTTPLDQAASIALTKTPDRTTLVGGQTVTYAFTATNTGTTTLSNVQIAEGAFNGLGAPMSALTGCSPALGSSLAAGASMTCTATYTVSQADVDRYATSGTTLDNAAGATGTPPTGPAVGDTANASILATPAPSVALTKSAGPVADLDANGTDAGDTLGYTFSVQNSGNLTLDPVTVADPLLAGQGIVISCPAGPLAPGATRSCTASAPYVLTQADIDLGLVNNTATASGTTPSGGTVTDPSSISTALTPSSELTLAKAPDRTTLVTGQTVTYTFTATNSGATTLADVQIAEGAFNGLGAPISALTGCTPALGGTLAPNQTMTCTATYLVTQADVNRLAADGTLLTNTATVTASPPTGPDVTATGRAQVPSTAGPALTLDKQVASVADVNRNGLTDAGDEIHYEFLLTNTGGATLTGLAVADPMLPLVVCDAIVLASAGQTVCRPHAAYVITQADVDAGGVRNTASASGRAPGGEPVATPPDSTFTPADQAVALTLDKRIALAMDMDGTGTVSAGDQVGYEFEVTNTGTVMMAGIAISDPKLAAAGVTITCPPDPVPAGGTILCVADAPYVVTGSDEAAGGVHNVATASGAPPSGSAFVSPPAHADLPTGSIDGMPGTGLAPRLTWLAMLGLLSLGAGLGMARAGTPAQRRR